MSTKKLRLQKTVAKFIKRNYDKWLQLYPNITGVNYNKKSKNGKYSSRNALIFHVSEKTKRLPNHHVIPSYFQLKHEGETIRIPTDVIETGRANPHAIFPGGRIFEAPNNSFWGSLGPLVTKGAQVYMLSSMHVLGSTHVSPSSLSVPFLPVTAGRSPDIFFDPGAPQALGWLESGWIYDGMDAAIALINPALVTYFDKRILGYIPTGYTTYDVTGLPVNVNVSMAGGYSGARNSVLISSIASVTLDYSFGAFSLHGLLQLSPRISNPGDSGAAIIQADTNGMKVVGIVVGADNNFTYGIPIYRILRDFKVSLY